MAFLVHKCPHCMTERVVLEVIGVSGQAPIGRSHAFAHLSCAACGMPAAAEIASTKPADPREDLMAYDDALSRHDWQTKRLWPEIPQPKFLEGLPPQVLKAFMAAEHLFPKENMEEAAAAQYGRALEIGTKLISGEDAQGNLYQRINALAAKHRITPDIAEWAHEIRAIRNSALHEVEDLGRDELTAIRGFTEMVLTYLFTLPAMLEARRKAAGQQRE